jgi:hypothetical protein
MNLADTLNLGCLCRTLNPAALRAQLEADPRLAGLTQQLAGSHPHLFSQTAVFLDPAMRDAIAQAVAVLHRVMTLPAWQAHTMSQANPIAQYNFGPSGVSWATTSTSVRTARA